MAWAAAMAAHGRGQAVIGELDSSRVLRHEILRLGQEHQLIEPLNEQRRPLLAVHRDLAPHLLAAGVIRRPD